MSYVNVWEYQGITSIISAKKRYSNIKKYAQQILAIFNRSYQSNGTRRILHTLLNQRIIISRRYIARIMKSLSFTSKYTLNSSK